MNFSAKLLKNFDLSKFFCLFALFLAIFGAEACNSSKFCQVLSRKGTITSQMKMRQTTENGMTKTPIEMQLKRRLKHS